MFSESLDRNIIDFMNKGPYIKYVRGVLEGFYRSHEIF